MARWLPLLALIATEPALAQRRHPDIHEIPVAAARCLIQNEAKYVAARDEMMIIYLSLCPKVKPSARELAEAASNSIIINPYSTNIVIPGAKVKCLIDKIRLQQKYFNARKSIVVDVRRC